MDRPEPGVRRLVIRRNGGSARVSLRAVARPVLGRSRAARDEAPELTRVLRSGYRCLRASSLACRVRRRRLACR